MNEWLWFLLGCISDGRRLRSSVPMVRALLRGAVDYEDELSGLTAKRFSFIFRVILLKFGISVLVGSLEILYPVRARSSRNSGTSW
jgi:hypothetical protein